MKKIILNKKQVVDLIFENRYPVSGNKFLSRCIDGRYNRQFKNKNSKLKVGEILPALAIPGADLGELALILATANAFGFEVEREKAFETLVELVGGEENFHFHTDDHHLINGARHRVSPTNLVDSVTHESLSPLRGSAENTPQSASRGDPSHFVTPNKFVHLEENFDSPSLKSLNGCGHWKQLQSDPAAYHLESDDIKFINSILKTIVAKIEKPVVLEGEHQEGAILLVKGDFGIYPRYTILSGSDEDDKNIPVEVQVFVYHQSLANKRHRELAKKLVEKKAVKLYPGCDEEYLYQVLSDEAENHLFETAKRLAKGLPLFRVEFKEEGEFVVEEMGEVC